MILEPDGRPWRPAPRTLVERLERRIEEAEAAMQRMVEAAMFSGRTPEDRVFELRRSVLGEEAGPPPRPLTGLAAWLPAPGRDEEAQEAQP